MIRALVLLLVAILVIPLLRSLIGFIAQLFLNAAVGPERRADAPRSGKSPSAEALQRDPVCGTFVVPSTAIRLERKGETFYFCSPACRDKF